MRRGFPPPGALEPAGWLGHSLGALGQRLEAQEAGRTGPWAMV